MRALLDSLGATATKITVTSDLDEFAIAALAASPVDSYGVGTSLVTGSGHPTAGFVYKLVERESGDGAMAPVAKRSTGKVGHGGRKWASRRYVDQVATAEVLRTAVPDPSQDERPLQVAVMRDGQSVGSLNLDVARERRRA